jgi:hypothetical protein
MSSSRFLEQEYMSDMTDVCLRKRGWNFMGSGCYAQVLSHDNMTDKVVKITRMSDNMRIVFDTFRKVKHPCFPKIYRYKEFRNSKGQELASIVMERLDPITDCGSKIEGVNRIARDYANGSSVADIIANIQNDYNDIKASKRICSCGNPDCEIYNDTYYDDNEGIRNYSPERFAYANLHSMKYRRLLLEAIDILNEAFGEHNYVCWDLHDANIMRRGQVPVITDPCT